MPFLEEATISAVTPFSTASVPELRTVLGRGMLRPGESCAHVDAAGLRSAF